MKIKDALKQEFNDKTILTSKEALKQAQTEANVKEKGVNPNITVGNKHFEEYNKEQGCTSHSPGKNFLAIHGCNGFSGGCIWKGTKYCFLNFDRESSEYNRVGHKNKICNYRIEYVNDMRDIVNDGKGNGLVSERIFKILLDTSWHATHKMNQSLQNEDNPETREYYAKQAIEWTKLSLDGNLRWIKHKEGTKVEITNKLDSLRGVIDVEVKDVEVLDVDKL